MSCPKILILGILLVGFCGFTWGLGISSRLVYSVCRQREKFSTSQSIQPAQKTTPPQQIPCGRFFSSKCSPGKGKTLRCKKAPSFKFRPCDKAGRSLKASLRLLGEIADPNLFITFKKSTAEITNGILEKRLSETSVDRAAQLVSTVKALKEFSFEKQKDVIDFIKASARGDSIKVTSLWLTNQILVQGADLDLQRKLMMTFAQDIDITQDKIFKLDKDDVPPGPPEEAEARKTNASIYGVEKIEADKVWAEGNKGEGVIVGLLDSGVISTHKYLKDNFIGNEKGWFDPYLMKEEPYDAIGHGTFTSGIIVANANKIGVAPASKFMMCVGCNFEGCLKSNIVKCFQWMLCPSKKPDARAAVMDDQDDGVSEDQKCEGAPHIISNSWTTDKGIDEDINNAIKATAAAGVILVFAAGNEGGSCSSIGSPSELDVVISVGAVNRNDTMPYFSGRGPPTGTKIIKPDMVAPGEDIVSTYTGDAEDDTNVGTATSFSTPFVSGTVALLLKEKPDVTLEQVKECLFKTAIPIKQAEGIVGQNCGGVKDTEVPNNLWGHGQLNAYKAVQYLKESFMK